ncbi:MULTISPECIES: hypothetical protein [unclassified Tolypothrix]|uniref:hypothetical protein n=1 Tax=unclassified Tolypothrix TaxID=2649714 RepID=UPI000906EE0D|nr:MULTISPECIES: hypothetical protein [unclassified Tolypothrix]MBE9084020.1 hypothetical protein [Tolypothrix sp. LEGE 11397]UYD26522.1 hypothetical protein HGR01_35465 [Tolypothrix sp. PCC 7712]UYD31241.1 hypothetical protein HG267_19015 [Tolypothrix sp. PCC 7601]BAY92568.1 hypothetical protein NIES3275_46040 [Microchaete diplosiphon NIES-3275]
MNKKFVLSLLSTPAVFMSMLSMVMMTKPAHGQTVTPVGTHLSCVRSPHSATAKQVCIQVSNASATPANSEVKVAQLQSPNQPAELEFTDAESDEAIKLFGCDCSICINAVRQLHGLAPMPV